MQPWKLYSWISGKSILNSREQWGKKILVGWVLVPFCFRASGFPTLAAWTFQAWKNSNLANPKNHGISSSWWELQIPDPKPMHMQTPLFCRVQWFLGWGISRSKAVSIDPEELLSRLEAWNVQLSSPMLSDDRLQALEVGKLEIFSRQKWGFTPPWEQENHHRLKSTYFLGWDIWCMWVFEEGILFAFCLAESE